MRAQRQASSIRCSKLQFAIWRGGQTMALIPSMLLRQLYTFGSLKNADHGVQFSIKNRLSDAEFTELQSIRINGSAVPLGAISIDLGDGVVLSLDRISPSHPIAFPLRQTLIVRAGIAALP